MVYESVLFERKALEVVVGGDGGGKGLARLKKALETDPSGI